MNAHAEDALCFFDGVDVQCFDESCCGLSVETKGGHDMLVGCEDLACDAKCKHAYALSNLFLIASFGRREVDVKPCTSKPRARSSSMM